MDAVVQLKTALAGRYEVDREIGAGGMATVYLARDIKHKRNVALKVFRPDLGAVLGVERFLSEIQVTANLQHPNLLPLFDSGEAGGLLFYVMPFVEGESLRARLDREKQLPIDEAVRIATAIASALGYAHDNGVIHRDLKPENILLQAGQPVIADFGIALAVSNAGAGRVTQTGISLGTPHYMSPEQATGDRAIDGRTDIYSLGAMTYEMLVGDPPYLGSTSQAIIAKVLTERAPSARTARPNVPEHVDAAIEHALEKLPADRFATAREFGDAVSGKAIFATTATRNRSVASRRGWREQVLAPVPLVAIGLAVAATVFALRERARPAVALPRVQFDLALADSVRFRSTSGTGIAISADGSMIAYTGGEQQKILIRRLDQKDPIALAGTERGVGPIFSADGRWLSFLAPGNIRKKVPVTGGPVETLLEEAGQVASWGDGDVIVSARTNAIDSSTALWRVSPTGGRPEVVLALPKDSTGRSGTISRPEVLPGGKAVVFQYSFRGGGVAPGAIAAARLGDSKISVLGIEGTNPHYVAGYLLFARFDGTVGAIAFDLSTLTTSGPEVTVLEDVAVRSGGAAQFGVARNGTLVYVTGSYGSREIVTVDRSNGRVSPVGAPAGWYETPRFSPDGKRIAVGMRLDGAASRRTARYDIGVFDVASKTLTHLTRDGYSSEPTWTPDGKRVAWMYADSVRMEIRWQPWDQSALPALFFKTDSIRGRGAIAINFSPTAPVFAYTTSARDPNIGMASVTPPWNPREIISTPSAEGNPRISPDGKWLAYSSAASPGASEIFVRPFPGPGGVVKVSTEIGFNPVWSNVGLELLHGTPNGDLMSVTLGATPELHVVRRETLRTPQFAGLTGITNFDVSKDGKQVLGVVGLGDADRIVVVQGWITELRERMAQATKK